MVICGKMMCLFYDPAVDFGLPLGLIPDLHSGRDVRKQEPEVQPAGSWTVDVYNSGSLPK